MSSRPLAEDGAPTRTVLDDYDVRRTAGHIPRHQVEMPIHEPVVDEAKPWIGPRGEVMQRLELHLTYQCPERCVFCSEEHRMAAYAPYPVTWGRVATVLRTHALRGVRNVHLTGGEPTLHPRFVEVCALARKLGMRTSVGTIGTRLSEPKFADRALEFLDEIMFSLHGPDAATHDRLTRRAGSFDTVTSALAYAVKHAPHVRCNVNTVVTRHNVEQLGDTVAIADSLGAGLIIVSNTTPEGGGLDHFRELGVSLATLARIMPTIPSRAPRAVLRFFGMPMCLLGEHDMLSNDLHWDPRVTVEWSRARGRVVFDSFYNWAPDRKRRRVAPCEICARRDVCMGVYDHYADLYDVSELRPYGHVGSKAPPG